MPDNAELNKLADKELEFIIQKAHNSGLNYWQILKIFLRKVEMLVMLADTEYWLKGGR
jgi:hypothetical protein